MNALSPDFTTQQVTSFWFSHLQVDGVKTGDKLWLGFPIFFPRL